MASTFDPPTGRFQRATSTYNRGTRQINMLCDDSYTRGYESDSDQEDDMDDNHLQGLSTIVVNNI